MSEAASFQSCAICGRTILRGEQVSEYVDGEGQPAVVCALCKARAEASGWVLAQYATTVDRPAPEPRRARAAAILRQRLARRGEAASEPEPEAPEAPATAPEPEPVAETRRRTPLEVFNASGEPRKIAGLVRSLGEPKASVQQIGESAAQIVVAWDLSWYRWRVRGEQVSELAKGSEISELPVADREWNAHVDEDGSLVLD